jgi:hypothetical protein
MYLMEHFHLDGAGALAALTLGLTASVAWRHGWPGGGACTAASRACCAPSSRLSWPRLAIGPGPTFARDVEHGVGALWWWLAQPLLFGMIGLNLDFGALGSGTADDALAVIFSGWLPRPLLTILVVGGAGLSWRERAFVGAAWMPKASVQAALASAPLDAILARGLGPEWVEWGRECQVTATIAILICATVGIVAVNVLSPICLNKGPGVDALGGGGRGGGGGTTGGEEGASVSAEAGVGVAATTAPLQQLPPSASPFAALASTPAALSSFDEAAAVEKLKAREAALAQYVEEVDALARFVEGLEPSTLGPGGGRAATAARVAKQVRLDALALRKRALADHWLDSAPSALDLFAMDAAMRRRFVRNTTGGAAGNGNGRAGGRRGGRLAPGTDAAVAAAAAALGASAAAARGAAAAGDDSSGPAPPFPPARLVGRWRTSGDGLGRVGSGASAGSGAGAAADPSADQSTSSSARRWSREVMRRMGIGGGGSGGGSGGNDGGEGGGGGGGGGGDGGPPPPPAAAAQ